MRRLVMGLTLSLIVLLAGCGPSTQAPTPDDSDGVTLLEGMGGTPDPGFARAIEAREFIFPEDHGPHPDFATEWWYFTGNLFTREGQRFGYQLTLFRIGLAPGEPADDSSWRTNQMYMGHFAVSDVSRETHYQDERFSRAAAGLAGAQADPLRVWLGPWTITGEAASTFPLTLRADTDQFGLELLIERGEKAAVLQGDRGLSQKSAAPGNASYYYSHTRLPSSGSIRIGSQHFEVTGNSWFDREWSSSALADDQAGWDWFALQLEDGRDLMFYRMRGTDGQAQRFSKGVLVGTDGSSRLLRNTDVNLEPLRHWTSADGRRYPVAWRLTVPEHALDLRVEATFDDQLMRTAVSYWEGAVDVQGSHSGIGYLEMSGYSPGARGEVE
ncbi:MAG: lipocalin-like domain-containing protein [Chromatiaceae bacterium]|jgi:predicted secreted hydrolase